MSPTTKFAALFALGAIATYSLAGAPLPSTGLSAAQRPAEHAPRAMEGKRPEHTPGGAQGMPEPAPVASAVQASPFGDASEFTHATGLEPLAGDAVATMSHKALRERLEDLERLATRSGVRPPEWFVREHDDLSNRLFAEERVEETPVTPELAAANEAFRRAVAEHRARYGDTREEDLAHLKLETFNTHAILGYDGKK